MGHHLPQRRMHCVNGLLMRRLLLMCTDVARGAMVCLLSVRAGQYIDARFKSINNSKSVIIKHASFSAVALP